MDRERKMNRNRETQRMKGKKILRDETRIKKR